MKTKILVTYLDDHRDQETLSFSDRVGIGKFLAWSKLAFLTATSKPSIIFASYELAQFAHSVHCDGVGFLNIPTKPSQTPSHIDK